MERENITGKIMFEGKYLNGLPNGRGKKYNENGALLFEGEYLNGMTNEPEIKYYQNGAYLIFEREYLNGRINNLNDLINLTLYIFFKIFN